MKLLREIPETAMVAIFLKAELHSERFSDELKEAIGTFGVREAQITQPDISNEPDNELRAKVLGAYRGYRQNREIFKDIPDKLNWYEAEISRIEIGTLGYVDYSYWNELTNQSHLVSDGVKSIRRGKIVFNVPHDRFLAVAEDMRHGKQFEPMILWGQSLNSPLTILEGHLRATAFGLAAAEAPTAIKVIVGFVKRPNDYPELSNNSPTS